MTASVTLGGQIDAAIANLTAYGRKFVEQAEALAREAIPPVDGSHTIDVTIKFSFTLFNAGIKGEVRDVCSRLALKLQRVFKCGDYIVSCILDDQRQSVWTVHFDRVPPGNLRNMTDLAGDVFDSALSKRGLGSVAVYAEFK